MHSTVLKRFYRLIIIAVCTFFLLPLLFASAFADSEPSYDAADLVRTARMVGGIIEPDPEFADLTGDGEVTEADLALMTRLVHGQEPPELLEETTIGAGGGTIGDAQTMEVEVPAGTFDADTDLVLHRLPEEDAPRGGTEQGPLYQVSGIPFDAGESLTIRIPLPKGFDPEKAFIEIGEPGFSTSGFGWQYQTLDAEIIDDALVWELEPISEEDWKVEPAGSQSDDSLFSPVSMAEITPASCATGLYPHKSAAGLLG